MMHAGRQVCRELASVVVILLSAMDNSSVFVALDLV